LCGTREQPYRGIDREKGAVRVLVTGGSGRLGQQVLHELIGHGHEVVNADRRPPGAAGLGPYREVELSDVGHVAGALSGCDAVVHLGAIPTANSHPTATPMK